jgi:hypothetical protein
MKSIGKPVDPGSRFLVWVLPVFAALFFFSCSANINSSRIRKDLDRAMAGRDIPTALKIVEKPGMYRHKERLLYYLDAGMLHHINGNWEQSNELLSLAEEAIEELYTKSIARAAGSMILNDRSLEYSGEDYEDIYINVFKALNFLELGDRAAAMVEVRRVDDKLSALEQKYARIAKDMDIEADAKVQFKHSRGRFHSSALASYISMVLYLADNKKDDARIDYDNINFAFKSQPELYPFSAPDITNPINNSEDSVLRVLSFVNRGPTKLPLEMHIHTSKDMLILASSGKDVDIDAIPWPGIEDGYYFKFAIPYIEERPARVGRVDVVTGDGTRYNLHKLEDLSQVAKRSFELKEPMIILKSVSRTVMKGLAAERAKEEAEKNSSDLGSTLLGLVADAAVFLSENADLRISQFFPGQALITEIPLPKGEQSLRIEYFSPHGSLLHTEQRTVNIRDGAPNLLRSWYF